MSFIKKIATGLVRCGVDIKSRPHIGVAFSGGADSTALLTALHELGLPIVALHCNFHLRGEESNADSQFCHRLCSELGVEILSIDFDTLKERRPEESIEMAARRLRYGWFAQMKEQQQLDFIAFGHHREDSEETLFLNLLRGTGPRGLAGIPHRRDIFVRPMLDLTRQDIEQYLHDKGLSYCTDSTNMSNDYRRNALRNEILPVINRYFPSASKGIENTIEAMQHSMAMLDTYIAWCVERFTHDEAIDISLFPRDNFDAEGTLYLLIAYYFGEQCTMKVIKQILAKPEASGRIFPTLDGSQLELHRGRLIQYTPLHDIEWELDLSQDIFSPVSLEVTMLSPAEYAAEQFHNRAVWLDADILKAGVRLTMRHRHTGDRITPWGLKGSRLLSDIFSDLHLSNSKKNSLWILCADDNPIWIVGVRAGTLWQATPKSQQILKISLPNN